MQFFLSLAALVGVALAQNAGLGLPTEGQQLSPDSDFIVQVQRPNSLTGSKEMAVAIGISSCANNGCRPSGEVLGTVLYNGEFKPVYHETFLPPYQNFTVKVPSDLKSGKAQINVAHATLVGAGPIPFLETLNRTVIIG